MITNLESAFSVIANSSKRSAIREILKLTQKPDIISFAGGLPSADSFPVEDIRRISDHILSTMGTTALQYGTTEGCVQLKDQLIAHYACDGTLMNRDNLLITTSSQQGLDLVAKIFINPGDTVICGLPSYLGGISAFRSYGAKLEGIELDAQGMRSDLLEQKLEALKKIGVKPKFIYIIPDFQNPAGITMPVARRKEILELAYRYDVLIVEDSPYRELRFDGEAQDMIYKIDTTGHVIALGTFSKILAPGFRTGWAIGHPEIIDKLVVAKQATDLCTPAILQLIIARYMEEGLLHKNLPRTIAMYREKRDLMLKCFDENMPEGVSWTEPEGGLFLFMTLPKHMNAEKLFAVAIENKVAFVLGQTFYCDGGGQNTLRLNFSFATHEQIVEGVKRLAKAIKEYK
ncbi:MAG TPA: PLP-dependent aminotransferase family protein [Bacteroidales bacterium]|nr:PLP-dependent aminotransferase family protein [Bacteroidales bacterium]